MDTATIVALVVITLIVVSIIGVIGYEIYKLNTTLQTDQTQITAENAALTQQAATIQAQQAAQTAKELAHDKKALSGDNNPTQAVDNYFLQQSGLSTADVPVTSTATPNTTTPSTLTQFISRFVAKAFGGKRASVSGATARMMSPIGPVVVLDGFLAPPQITKVAWTVQRTPVGDVIDLYSLTGIRELGYESSAVYRVGGAVQFGEGVTTYMRGPVAVAGALFTREDGAGMPGWRYRGSLGSDYSVPPPTAGGSASDARLATGRTDAALSSWDVYMLMNEGNSMKVPRATCPFDPKVCPAIWAWVADGNLGTLTFSDGTRYEFDGRFVRGPY